MVPSWRLAAIPGLLPRVSVVGRGLHRLEPSPPFFTTFPSQTLSSTDQAGLLGPA